MTKEEFQKLVDHEASWLKYYGFAVTRTTELYNDVTFYDRIQSIGYTKRVILLSNRCVAAHITSKRPVLESSIEELEIVSGPRNHEINVFTPLEYAFANNLEGTDKLRELLKS